MSDARIGIYLRLRPPRRSAGRVATDTEGSWVEFNVPKDAAQGLINNSKESYRFQFDGVFPPDVQQDIIFENIAKPAISDALDGINGTIFAYGQTGSGKTFTVTGGTERYADRGLIPRAVSAIFQEIQERSTRSYNVTISYLELYNEEGFDLLDPTREVKRMEDLPKVFVMEDDDSRMHVRNLSAHHTSTEEEALNLLFLGGTNRMVAETPLNQASSRSHAIFSISIESRQAGDDRVRRSKLNFVDLAGSERVTKTGIEGRILHEAKYINLSLHFLEQVIISLQEHRPHVPYRNSLLTQMLKDSLGGNCRTVMIANVAPENQHIEESISTCRFAQRVAMIKNKVTVNEEVDPRLLIKRLKQENQLLKNELQLLKGIGGQEPQPSAEGEAGQQRPWQQLSGDEELRLKQKILAFVEDTSPEANLDVEASMAAIHAAFYLFKSMVKETRPTRVPRKGGLLEGQAGISGDAGDDGQGRVNAGEQSKDLVSKLEDMQKVLRQKEREVAILAGMLRKQGTNFEDALSMEAGGLQQSTEQDGKHQAHRSLDTPPLSSGSENHTGGLQKGSAPAMAGAYHDGILADKNRAFEFFCPSSTTHDGITDNKALLRNKYDEAKSLGSRVNASKQRMSELRGLIEQRRVQRSMAALMQGEPVRNDDDPEEEKAKALLEKEKVLYHEGLGQLKVLKSDIDQLQTMLNHSRGKLQREFATWYGAMLNQLSPDQRQRIEQQEPQQQQQEAITVVQQSQWQIAAKHSEPGDVASQNVVRLQEHAHAHSPQPSSAAANILFKDASVQDATTATPAWQPSIQNQTESEPGMGAHRAGRHTVGWRPTSALNPNASPVQHQTANSRPGSRLWDAGSSLGDAQDRWAAVQYTGHIQARQSTSGCSQHQQQQQLPVAAVHHAEKLAADTSSAHLRPSSARSISASSGRSGGGLSAEYAGVEPEVLAAAKPLLTGNAAADADIIKFYQARAALLKAHMKH